MKRCKQCHRPMNWHTMSSWAIHKLNARTIKTQRAMRKAGLR